MNKKIVYIIIAVFSFSTLMFNSCKKENLKNDSASIGVVTPYIVSPEAVEATIIDFNVKYDNHNQGFKSDEDVSFGKAIWLLEAGLNYEFRSNKESVSKSDTKVLKVNVPASINRNNEYSISGSNVFDLYQEFIDFVAVNKVEGDELLYSDIEIESVEKNSINLIINAVYGNRYVGKILINSTDYWYPTMGDGKCGSYVGQGVDKDASDRLEEVLQAAQLAGVSYWTSIVNTYDIDPLSNTEYYDNFWHSTNNSECLSPTEMNFYRVKMQEVVAGERPSSSHHRIELEVGWDLFMGSPSTWIHRFDNIKYGVPHFGISPAG